MFFLFLIITVLLFVSRVTIVQVARLGLICGRYFYKSSKKPTAVKRERFVAIHLDDPSASLDAPCEFLSGDLMLFKMEGLSKKIL